MTELPQTVPFHTFLWKIASRCNLNCSYCYIYNLDDSTWRTQPHFMSEAVARKTVERMVEHCRSHDKKDLSISLHGGEPLLGGIEHVDMITSIIAEGMEIAGITTTVGMQSNGLLFSPEIGDLFLKKGVRLGISLDGPPHINDRYRVDHRGRGSSARLEEKLKLLFSDRYRSIFSGFLCVIDVTSDPVEVTDYLTSFPGSLVDFLFPDNNHTNLPAGKTEDPDATPYADWLIPSFDYWFSQARNRRIRIFNSIMSLLMRGPSQLESIGLGPVDLIVVESNGEIEAVDTMKSTYNGAAKLGYNIFDHDFDTVARDQRVQFRQIGEKALCETCRQCPIVDVCGGGYLPNRYREENGFDNPSVYCEDLKKLIQHIGKRLHEELQQGLLSRPLSAHRQAPESRGQ